MNTLEQMLSDKGFDVRDFETKETIMDNEYILRSHTRQKRLKAQKNLQMLFYKSFDRESPVIKQVVDEFLRRMR